MKHFKPLYKIKLFILIQRLLSSNSSSLSANTLQNLKTNNLEATINTKQARVL